MIRRLLAMLLVLSMAAGMAGGCFLVDKPDSDRQSGRIQAVDRPSDRETKPPAVTPTAKPAEPTAYDYNIQYLRQNGLNLPRLDPQRSITSGQLLTLLGAIYPMLDNSGIDLSLLNPALEESDGIRILRFLGVYSHDYFYELDLTQPARYYHASHWLLELYKSIRKRLYHQPDGYARIRDLLDPINISTTLYTWSADQTAPALAQTIHTIPELIETPIGGDDQLTRLLAAHLLVAAYEPLAGEITPIPLYRPTDTDDLNAWKASSFFLWLETQDFDPDGLMVLDEPYSYGVNAFDDQLRIALQPDDAPCPYGAVVSAVATLMRSFEGIPQNPAAEFIVLNERPYPWHVHQLDTGEYGYSNCMPSCVEMALRYQSASIIPTAESLRQIYPLDGLGWTDYHAQTVMDQYGLLYRDSYDLTLDSMLQALDEGNIIYVMYREPYAEEGHAVIIKGYWRFNEQVQFIIADPMHTWPGPFGYPEVLMDAGNMLDGMARHVTRHFIISPEP